MIWINFSKCQIKGPNKNTWRDWLINYIPEPIIKSVGGLKDKVTSLFNKNAPKETVYGSGQRLSQIKTQKKSGIILYQKIKQKKIKDKRIRDIWNFLKQKKKKRIKYINNRLIKDIQR